MESKRAALLLTTALASAGLGCDPYERYGDETSSAGAVDPVNFPAANLGMGGDRLRPGRGNFTEVLAFIGGQRAGYYAYIPPAPAMGADPLRLLDNGMPYRFSPAPKAYVFDPQDANPFPATSSCAPPQGYRPDPRLDEVRLDEQGNIFTALPTATYNPGVASATTYIPVVRQAAVSGAGVPCQQPKSEAALLSVLNRKTPADIPASDRFLAWLIIDPAAAVYREGQSAATSGGVGTQKLGWFNRYLLAYIDGGYIPTMETTVMEPPTSMISKPIVRMVPQRLYYPRSMVMGAMTAAPGRIGAGYDVLTAKRGDSGYSPLCDVQTYDAGMMPVTPAALEKDAATIEAKFGMTLMPATPRYIYCLQVQ